MLDEVRQIILSEPEYSVLPKEADVLKNSRRRGIIRLLSDEKSKLSSLADSVLGKDPERSVTKKKAIRKLTEWENGDTSSINGDHLNRTRVSLLQHHLPRLEDENIINYNSEESIIEPCYPEIENYTELVEQKPCEESPFPDIDNGSEFYLTADQGFDILSNDRRQITLQYLNDQVEEIVEASEIAEFIALFEKDAIESDNRKSVYIGLIQNYLPRMDSRQVIEYDSDRKTVEDGRYFDTITEFLPEKIE